MIIDKFKNAGSKRNKLAIALYILTVPLIIYIYYHQTHENAILLEPLQERVVEYENAVRYKHPVIVMRHVHRVTFHSHEAIHKIIDDEAQKYWLITESIYPLMNVNYWVYPKEVYIDVESQIALYEMNLLSRDELPEPIPPKQYDKIVTHTFQEVRIED